MVAQQDATKCAEPERWETDIMALCENHTATLAKPVPYIKIQQSVNVFHICNTIFFWTSKSFLLVQLLILPPNVIHFHPLFLA